MKLSYLRPEVFLTFVGIVIVCFVFAYIVQSHVRYKSDLADGYDTTQSVAWACNHGACKQGNTFYPNEIEPAGGFK